MKLKILGSGGGEGYPAVFCGCAHCNAARKAGGKNLRSLSQAIVDGELLIDLPADTHMHLLAGGINLGDVENILVTHTHADHYYPNILELRGGVFARELKYEKLNVYGNADVKRLFDGVFSLFPIHETVRNNICFPRVEPYKKIRAGKYVVTPLHANHAPEQLSLNYIVEDGKSALLYMLDSGFPTEETLGRIAAAKKVFGCVVMDGTMGESAPGVYPYHMCFEENIRLKEYLMSAGAADGKTKFVTSHITHNGAGLHEDIERILSPHGISLAYDGFEAEF